MARRRKAAQWEMKPKNNKNGGRRCTRVSVRVNSAPLRLIMRNDRALSASVGPHGRSVTHNLALRPISSIGWTRGANIFQLSFNDFIKARASVMSVQSLWPQSVHRRVSRALLCSSSQCHRLALHWSTTPAEAPSCSFYTFAACYVVLCVSCFAQWLHLALCCVSGVVLPCPILSYAGTQRFPGGAGAATPGRIPYPSAAELQDIACHVEAYSLRKANVKAPAVRGPTRCKHGARRVLQPAEQVSRSGPRRGRSGRARPRTSRSSVPDTAQRS
jgi:hypothetical protein